MIVPRIPEAAVGIQIPVMQDRCIRYTLASGSDVEMWGPHFLQWGFAPTHWLCHVVLDIPVLNDVVFVMGYAVYVRKPPGYMSTRILDTWFQFWNPAFSL